MALLKLYKPSKIDKNSEAKVDLEFEKLVIRHIKKNRLKKCFRRKKVS